MNNNIPTEVYLDFLGKTIDIHWNYHAILMFSVWFILVPICIISLRYFKPKPTLNGISAQSKFSPKWRWFSIHVYGLYLAAALSLAGTAVAMLVSGGISGSVHSVFGLMTVGLGCLQIVSSWFRGTHGGMYDGRADSNDPSTWRGDHFDMTLRRRVFEAYHKNAGYFTIFCAVAAVATGLMNYWMPGIAIALVGVFISLFLLSFFFDLRNRQQDTYRSCFGYNAKHDYNKTRKNW
ncbi:cytochrome b561 domain-containing protein [Motiliproteus sp. MSK22-1]|uniref:cytochrome b561 domain-containing protein n=1 Tax=Motiliproteus sp. MSK22-1 TaxID=1897630 RepID=UPI0009766C93|nr:cytochrome b561 domain-containing protein [Motiliproteus sp. MSK22-1]OMH36221.1 hypothetical protein BGP75_09710 [Motiliproteus sp. MSK22-1]